MNELESLAENIATRFFETMLVLHPDFKELITQKIVAIAAEKWRFMWDHPQEIGDIIDKQIRHEFETTFKPALDEIARRKAREKVKARALKNGIQPETLPGLSELPGIGKGEDG